MSMPCRFITHEVIFHVLRRPSGRSGPRAAASAAASASRIGIWSSTSAAAEQVGRRRCGGRAAHRRRGRAVSPARSRRARPASDRASWSWCRRRRCRPRAPRAIQSCSVGRSRMRDIGAWCRSSTATAASERSAASIDGGVGVAGCRRAALRLRRGRQPAGPGPATRRSRADIRSMRVGRVDRHRRRLDRRRGRCRSPRRRGASAS